MKMNVTKSTFRDMFAVMGRAGNYSYEGLNALYDYLIAFEEETGEEIELDVIALCCDYTEYGDINTALKDYGVESLDGLYDLTTVIPFDGGIIIQNF